MVFVFYSTASCFPSLLVVNTRGLYTQLTLSGVCWSKKVHLGTCTYFSGKVQGFIWPWGIEILCVDVVGELPLQGESRLMS